MSATNILTVFLGIILLLTWIGKRYERHMRVWLKRNEPKVYLDERGQKAFLEACDLLIEIYENEPESDEYRIAVEAKTRLERLKAPAEKRAGG